MTFRQIIGVPIGVHPGPFIANLTLFYYEYKYLDKLYRIEYYSAKRLNNTFRLKLMTLLLLILMVSSRSM